MVAASFALRLTTYNVKCVFSFKLSLVTHFLAEVLYIVGNPSEWESVGNSFPRRKPKPISVMFSAILFTRLPLTFTKYLCMGASLRC